MIDICLLIDLSHSLFDQTITCLFACSQHAPLYHCPYCMCMAPALYGLILSTGMRIRSQLHFSLQCM